MPRLVAVLALVFSFVVQAESPDDSIEGFIASEMNSSGAPGLSYAVVAEGEITSAAVHGVANAGSGTELTPETPFVIGSITKSFTAVAVMQLVEAGEVELDAQLSVYLDEFLGRPAGSITIRQLLGHTSGFSTLQGNASHTDTTDTNDELERHVAGLAEVEPDYEPGERWDYSNTNYQILGRVIEVVSDQHPRPNRSTRCANAPRAGPPDSSSPECLSQRATTAMPSLASFQGDDRLVVEYLTDEFLSGVTDHDRARLLQTSVLDRMCGPLVDAVCDTTDGTQWLQHTASTNQLVIGLDRTDTWYRYHHLLADLLRLEAERTTDLTAIHGRAAAWHRHVGSSHSAVEHYIAAQDLATAADLIYDDATELMNRGQLRTVRHQIDRLGEIAEEHAGTMVVRGWISLLTGNFADAQASLERARALEPNDDEAGLIVALAIMAHIASGNVARALDEAASASDPFESTQAMTLGGAHIWGGDFDKARALLKRATEMAPQEGNTFVEAVTPIFSAIGHIESGDTHAAQRDANAALAIASANGFDDLAQVALAHSILARTTATAEEAIASAERGVDLARQAPEYIMFTYALASAGDVLCHHDDDRGAELLAEARGVVDRCLQQERCPEQAHRVRARTGLARRSAERLPSCYVRSRLEDSSPG